MILIIEYSNSTRTLKTWYLHNLYFNHLFNDYNNVYKQLIIDLNSELEVQFWIESLCDLKSYLSLFRVPFVI